MTGSWRRDTVWQVRAWPRRCARQPLRRSSDRRRNILTVSPKRGKVKQSDNNIIMLSDLLQCTNEPNVSIPTLANLLIERTLNPNWVVVYKSLITIHHLMCYGNEVKIPSSSAQTNQCLTDFSAFHTVSGIEQQQFSTGKFSRQDWCSR